MRHCVITRGLFRHYWVRCIECDFALGMFGANASHRSLHSWLLVLADSNIPRAIKICVDQKVASIVPKFCMQHPREVLKRMTWPHSAMSFCTLGILASWRSNSG